MKLIFMLGMLVLLGISQSTAQFIYNKTYYNSYSPTIAPVDHINAFVNGNSVMLSRDEGAGSTDKGIILTKFDDQGNVLFERFWNINGSSNFIRPDKIVFTDDNGFIVAGIIFHGSGVAFTANPFAAKFTFNGDHAATEWAKEYPANNNHSFITWHLGRSAKANIVKVSSPGDENYIISMNAKPTEESTNLNYPADNGILAIRLRGSDGNVVWANKYEIPYAIRSSSFSSYPSYTYMANSPQALASGDGYNLISGVFDSYRQSTGLKYEGFHMVIDDNGNINLGYNKDPGYLPSNHNAIYDYFGNGGGVPPAPMFALTYDVGAHLAGPSSSRAVAIQKFLITPGSVTPTTLDYYTDGGDELFVKGIANKHLYGSYTLSLWSRLSEGLGTGNMAMMHVEKSGAVPAINPYTRFNPVTPTITKTPIISLLNSTLTQERNVILGITNRTSGANGIRMISADVNLDACGAEPGAISGFPQTPIFESYPYVKVPIAVVPVNLTFTETSYSTISDDCDLSVFPPAYRPSDNTLGQMAISDYPFWKIYPTLIKDGDNIINVELTFPSKSNLDATLLSIDGKAIASKRFVIAEGNQILRFPVPMLNAGTYIFTIRTGDNKISSHIWITKVR